MRHTILTLLISLTLLAAPSAVLANDDVNGVMLQGWYWDSPVGEEWWNKLSKMAPQFREWGITGIWLPAFTKGASGGYSSGYDPYDFYDLGSQDQRGTIPTKWGHKRDLLKMISILHANGIDAYADIVPNHRSGGTKAGYEYKDLRGSEAVGRFTMAPWDFHPKDWHGDWYEAVAGLPDINQDLPYVRDGFFKWIRWFDKQTGVDGYRIDAVKHMKPEFTEGLLYQVQEGMGQSRFSVGEFYDGNPNTLQWWVNANRGRSSVFDFTLFFQLLSMAHGNGYYDMRNLRNRFYDDRHSVTFCNSHDTFRRANGLHLYNRSNLAYAFILAAPGYPCVYWQDLFDDNGNVRQFMVNLIWIHHMMARGAGIERYADEDLYVLEREGNLLAGYNDNTGSWKHAWVRTHFGPNVRLHDYAGDVGDVWTNQHGWARIAVPPNGYVMYGRDGLQGKQPNPPVRRTSQEFEAEKDMDMRPAGEWWSEPTPFTSEANEPVHIDVWLKDTSKVAHVALFDDQGNRINHARGKGHVYFSVNRPSKRGWYYVRVGLEQGQGQGGQSARSGYFLKIKYQGPREDVGHMPNVTNFQTLPLLPSSVGP